MGFAILTFLTVTMSIVVGHQLINSFLSRDSERVRERMANEFGQAAGTSAVSPLYKNLDQLSLESAVATNLDGAAPPKPAPRLGLMAQISAWLGRSDLSWGPFHLFAWMTCLAGVAGSIAGWFGGHVAGVSAALAAALAPMIYVHIAIGARRERYLKQLPNAFELMARIIRAGQSVPQALQAVAEAFDNPLAGEFKACLQKQNLGMRPETAFQAMAEASGIVEVRIFSMAMMI